MNIALIGNPNCGKTTLFNSLTGSNQYVGNWPGVTVEKKVGQVKKYGVSLVDLPGIYSLSPYSMEEVIARDYILKEKPQGIINILDGTNLERNLYLTLQILELGIPVVTAVNMSDTLKLRGDHIDYDGMEAFLGIPVVPISAKKGINSDLLMEKMLYQRKHFKRPSICYPPVTQKYINLIKNKIKEDGFENFFAPKLLESDAHCLKNYTPREIRIFEEISSKYEQESRLHDRELSLADSRYQVVEQISHRFIHRNPNPSKTFAEKADEIVLNRFLAIPIFIGLLFLIFYTTFSGLGTGLQNGMEFLMETLLEQPLSGIIRSNGMPDLVHGLLIGGIFRGISSVLCFLPQILILFFCLSLLEDSGYMARAAFMMDCLLEKIGLSGKAFIPMLMGFGCTTPAVMAARTMENERDRRLTVLLTPFMSCGAKLPIYALFTGVFFQEHRGMVLFSLYFLGMLTAVLCGLFLKSTLFKTSQAPFVMELPPYRMPGLRSTFYLLWDKAKGFLIKAGTIIFSMSVVIWLMQNVSPQLHFIQDGSDSILGRIGSLLAPVLAPLGFGSQEAGIALLSGLIAKESVVSSLTVLYGGNPSLGIASHFTPMGAYSFMVFCLLYVPCVSAFSTMVRELKSKGWVLFSFCLQMAAAYGLTFLIYQSGQILIR